MRSWRRRPGANAVSAFERSLSAGKTSFDCEFGEDAVGEATTELTPGPARLTPALARSIAAVPLIRSSMGFRPARISSGTNPINSMSEGISVESRAEPTDPFAPTAGGPTRESAPSKSARSASGLKTDAVNVSVKRVRPTCSPAKSDRPINTKIIAAKAQGRAKNQPPVPSSPPSRSSRVSGISFAASRINFGPTCALRVAYPASKARSHSWFTRRGMPPVRL